MGTAGRSSATFLPEGRARPAAGWAGADAADLLFAAGYGLADEAMEDALYDSQALRGFAGIDLSVATVPDATTV